jgi:putative copper export protein
MDLGARVMLYVEIMIMGAAMVYTKARGVLQPENQASISIHGRLGEILTIQILLCILSPDLYNLRRNIHS